MKKTGKSPSFLCSGRASSQVDLLRNASFVPRRVRRESPCPHSTSRPDGGQLPAAPLRSCKAPPPYGRRNPDRSHTGSSRIPPPAHRYRGSRGSPAIQFLPVDPYVSPRIHVISGLYPISRRKIKSSGRSLKNSQNTTSRTAVRPPTTGLQKSCSGFIKYANFDRNGQ